MMQPYLIRPQCTPNSVQGLMQRFGRAVDDGSCHSKPLSVAPGTRCIFCKRIELLANVHYPRQHGGERRCRGSPPMLWYYAKDAALPTRCACELMELEKRR